MKIKIFNIRLDKENFEKDQNTLNDFLKNVDFVRSTPQLVEGKISYWSILVHYNEKENFISEIEKHKEKIAENELNDAEKEIVAYFKQWRLDKSKYLNLPAYMVITNKTIYALAKFKPKNIEELSSIYGLGESKIKQYGEDIIALLNSI